MRVSAGAFCPTCQNYQTNPSATSWEMLYYQTNPSRTGVCRIAEFTSEGNAREAGAAAVKSDKRLKYFGIARRNLCCSAARSLNESFSALEKHGNITTTPNNRDDFHGLGGRPIDDQIISHEPE
jgi:hypothetical protein